MVWAYHGPARDAAAAARTSRPTCCRRDDWQCVPSSASATGAGPRRRHRHRPLRLPARSARSTPRTPQPGTLLVLRAQATAHRATPCSIRTPAPCTAPTATPRRATILAHRPVPVPVLHHAPERRHGPAAESRRLGAHGRRAHDDLHAVAQAERRNTTVGSAASSPLSSGMLPNTSDWTGRFRHDGKWRQ